MIPSRLIPCLLITRDAALAKRIEAELGDGFAIRRADITSLNLALEEIVLLDMRAAGATEALRKLAHYDPPFTVIALGIPESGPWQVASDANAYARVDVGAPTLGLAERVAQAAERAQLVSEIGRLRQSMGVRSRLSPTNERDNPTLSSGALAWFSRMPAALRSFEDVPLVLQKLIEDVAPKVQVQRAGLFSLDANQNRRYVLRACLRCLKETKQLSYNLTDPLPVWLHRHLHFVTRATVEDEADAGARTMLRRALNEMGAEVIVPLQLRDRLDGWLFLGAHRSGRPFTDVDWDKLALVADDACTVLDNALLHETTAQQHVLIETLLESMPSAVVAVDRSAEIAKYNRAAAALFERDPQTVLHQPIEELDSRVAGWLRAALMGHCPQDPQEWTDPRTERQLSAHIRSMVTSASCVGAVAFIQDLTLERLLAAKQTEIERATFWTELAAAMSHEIRNPLVTIKTFAQLLSDRYQDPEFRTEFAATVNAEISRLESMVEQINRFANRPPLVTKPVSVAKIIQRALDLAFSDMKDHGVWVDTAIEDRLPSVEGDETTLAECLAHLVRNAAEALYGRDNPKILIAAKAIRDAEPQGVLIGVQDNGPGIRPDLRGNVFSPFCTTKAQGLGLGLPLAQRIVVDHSGKLDIEAGSNGTCVYIRLPSTSPKKPPHTRVIDLRA